MVASLWHNTSPFSQPLSPSLLPDPRDLEPPRGLVALTELSELSHYTKIVFLRAARSEQTVLGLQGLNLGPQILTCPGLSMQRAEKCCEGMKAHGEPGGAWSRAHRRKWDWKERIKSTALLFGWNIKDSKLTAVSSVLKTDPLWRKNKQFWFMSAQFLLCSVLSIQNPLCTLCLMVIF